MNLDRTLLIALTLLVASLAGCAENTTDDGTGTPGDGDGTPGGDGTTGGDTNNTNDTGTDGTPGEGEADPTPTIDSILVGTEAAYPPFEDIRDGEIIGYDISVMREVANRSGFTVEFQNSDFSAIIPSIQNGQFDAGISAFTITEERRQQVDFSVPYYENSLMAAVREDNQDISTPEDLQGHRVCTQEGTTSEFYLREELGFAQEDLVLLENAPLCADALKRGDVDALMIDAAFVRSVIEANQGDLKQAFVIDDVDEQFGIAVRQGNDELLNAVNTALNEMRADGTLEQLQNEWQV